MGVGRGKGGAALRQDATVRVLAPGVLHALLSANELKDHTKGAIVLASAKNSR